MESSPIRIIFLSGLPRSGSTLLQSLLAQDTRIHAEGVSALPLLMLSVEHASQHLAKEFLLRADRVDSVKVIQQSLPRLFYHNVSKEITIDKNRIWCNPLYENLRYYIDKNPKTIVLVRSVEEIMRSFVAIRGANNVYGPVHHLLRPNTDPIMSAIDGVADALRKTDDNSFFFFTYNELVSQPQTIINALYNFCDIDQPQSVDTQNVKQVVFERDDLFQTKGMHDVRSVVAKREVKALLPFDIKIKCQRIDEALWSDYEQSKKINPSRFAIS